MCVCVCVLPAFIHCQDKTILMDGNPKCLKQQNHFPLSLRLDVFFFFFGRRRSATPVPCIIRMLQKIRLTKQNSLYMTAVQTSVHQLVSLVAEHKSLYIQVTEFVMFLVFFFSILMSSVLNSPADMKIMLTSCICR